MTRTKSGGFVLAFPSLSKPGHVNRAGISKGGTLLSCDCDRMLYVPKRLQVRYDERSSTVTVRTADVLSGAVKSPCKHIRSILQAVRS